MLFRSGEQKGDKIKVFKYRPKTGYAKRQGHRQLMTLLEIADVSLGPKRAAPKKAAAKKAAPAAAEAGPDVEAVEAVEADE